jgi:FdhE protein
MTTLRESQGHPEHSRGTTAGTALDGLKRKRPEWQPWLAVVEEVLREAGTSEWDAAVPADIGLGAEAHGAKVDRHTIPLLAGATLSVQTSAVRRILKRLIGIASRSGTPKMATLESALDADLDLLALFEASLCQDSDRIKDMAVRCHADADAFQGVIALASVPLLYACTRRWASSIPESWVEGYCSVCGSWPAFAEVRGIERSRYFRCGRCGGAWHARPLQCPYCAMHDHDELVSLVPEKTGSQAQIDACTHCRGYVKVFSTLQGCPPGTVMLEDLASVALDIAAMEQGYSRPSGAGYPLEATVIDKVAPRRFFAWNA